MTILFLEDWQKYPTAVPDLETRNKEFVKFAGLLKSMGVKNYYFCLALINPTLQGVDPFDPNLTLAQKTAIRYECEINFWYFLREIVRVPVDGTDDTMFYKPNRGVISLFWCLLNCIDYGIVMPRQTGKSYGLDIFKIWLIDFYYENTEIFVLTKDDKLRAKNIAKIKKQIKLLPGYLNLTTKKDADNSEVVTCVAKGNMMTFKVGVNNEDLARKMGRGHSLIWDQIDELAYIAMAWIAIPAMLAAGNAVKKIAKERGILYGNAFATTAGMLDTKEGAFAYSLINAGMYWNETVYDTRNNTEAKELIKTNCKGNLINGTFNHRQLGYTDKWLRDSIIEAKQSEDDANRDFLNIWTKGNARNPLNQRLIDAISCSEREPVYIQTTKELYQINWYIPEDDIERVMTDGWHIVTLDSGNAVGKDANALTIIDIRDLSIIATCRVTEAILHKYSIWLANFLLRYEKTIFIFENKSSGQSIMDTVAVYMIKYGVNPFRRCYNRIVDEHMRMEAEYKLISDRNLRSTEEIYQSYKGYFGFSTNRNSREFLYSTVFQEAAASTGHLIKDRVLISEINGLVEKNGRVDHIAGGHDDMVISWLLGHWFIKHSKNIAFYGIDVKECLSLVSNEGATLSPEKLEQRRKLAVLNIEINELKEKLMSALNIIESKKYEKLLEWKVLEANKLGDVTYSMNSILEDVRNNRVNKKSLRDALLSYQAKRNSIYK